MQTTESALCIAEFQRPAHISGHKPWFAFPFYGAHCSELIILKYG